MDPGIYHNVPLSDYLSWTHLSKTGLVQFAQSPAQYQWDRAHLTPPTARMAVGSAVDCLVFDGPKAFEKRFVRMPDEIKIRRGKAWDAFKAGLNGQEVLTADEYDKIADIARAVVEYPPAAERLKDGTSQLSIVWDDPDTGLRLKGRPDLVTFTNEVPEVVDLKVTSDPGREAFQRVLHTLKYHWQAYLYTAGLSVLHGFGIDQFSFVVVQDEPPYSVEVYRLDLPAIAQGGIEVREALARFAMCEKMEAWPASTGVVQTIDLPPWGYPYQGVDHG